MLTVSGINKSIKNSIILKDVSFPVRPGKVTGLLGKNGAGKTSLIRTILRIAASESGSVLLDGEKLSADFISQKTGYITEERGIYMNSSVLQNLLYIAKLRGTSAETYSRLIKHYSEVFGIESNLHKRCRVLSKGNQQIVQIISALIHDPEIIILDEPFDGLDPFAQEKLTLVLQELKTRNKYILLSTHLLDIAQKICDDIILMDNGEVLYSGVLADILSTGEATLETVSSGGKSEYLSVSELNGRLSAVSGITIKAVHSSDNTLNGIFLKLLEGKGKK